MGVPALLHLTYSKAFIVNAHDRNILIYNFESQIRLFTHPLYLIWRRTNRLVNILN